MELSLFLKENKIKRENAFFPATASLLDDAGNPLLWEIRPLSTREDETIREECTFFDTNCNKFRLNVPKYTAKVAAAATVEPNLYNVNLQNSYDVSLPEDLIKELIDDPLEYQNFVRFVQQLGKFDTPLSERVENAKN